MLAAVGHEVTAVADGDQALRQLREAESAFDVVVTDLVMPGASGREVTEAVLAAEGPGVVVTSGFRDRIQVDDLLRSERVRYLDKPFTPQDLLGAMAELTGRPSERGDPRRPVQVDRIQHQGRFLSAEMRRMPLDRRPARPVAPPQRPTLEGGTSHEDVGDRWSLPDRRAGSGRTVRRSRRNRDARRDRPRPAPQALVAGRSRSRSLDLHRRLLDG